MKGTFRAALRNECAKYARQKFPYLGVAFVALFAVFSVRGIRLIVGPRTDLNGFLAVIMGMIAAITLIIPLFAVIFASALVASETVGGTYRNVLSRPIGRATFLTAKIFFAFAYAVLLVALYVVVAVSVALGRYSFGPVLDNGEVVYSLGQILAVSLLACLLTLIPLFAIVSYGILASTAAKSFQSAFGIGVGLLIAVELSKHFVYRGDWKLADYIFTSYLDTALGIAAKAAAGLDYQWLPWGWWESDLGWGLMLSLGCAVVFLAASYAIFIRRDLNLS